MELDCSQMALEVSHHGYLLVTHLTTQEHCCHTSFHAYWYMNVMRSSRLLRVSLFLGNGSILMIWGCFSIVSNVIRSNYCCRRHTMHGNMVFSRDSIFPTHNKADVYLDAALILLIFIATRNIFGQTLLHGCCNVCPKKAQRNFPAMLWNRCVLAGLLVSMTELWLGNCITKLLSAPLLDAQKSLLIIFSPFQINILLSCSVPSDRCFTKWPPAAILDDRKSLSITFLAISDHYATLCCFKRFMK